MKQTVIVITIQESDTDRLVNISVRDSKESFSKSMKKRQSYLLPDFISNTLAKLGF